MQIKDIMFPVASAIDPEMSLRSATERMKALGIDPMPVSANGGVVGMLSGSVVHERAARDGLSVGSVKVAEVMDGEPICCTSDQSPDEVRRRYEAEHGRDVHGAVAVIDGAGKLLGVVSISALQRHKHDPGDGSAAVDAVEAVDALVEHDHDPVGYASDASFPASDPPSTER